MTLILAFNLGYYRGNKKFDNLSFKSKYSFLADFLDDLEKLNKPKPHKEDTKEKKNMFM